MRGAIVIACCIFATRASAQYLPPEEFDRPFDGRLVIQEARDSEEVRRLCPNMTFNITPMGCANGHPVIKICAIVKLSDEQLRANGVDPAIFMRHEVGHCNGWPANHRGARY